MQLVERCPECEGERWVANASWRAFFEAEPGQIDADEFARKHGPEEWECQHCNGAGVVLSQEARKMGFDKAVDAVLRTLGLIK